MQIERLRDVIGITADGLAPRGRAWIIGAARLTDHDEVLPVTSHDVQRLLADTREWGYYPTGRAAYLPEAVVETASPEYEALAVEISLEEPDYQGLVGLGTCRDLAMAESYQQDGPDRHGILLSDVEASVADLLILAYVRALHLDYRGRIDLMITLSDQGLDESPGLWHIDDVSGKAVATDRHISDFEPVEYTASMTATFEELFDVVRLASLDVSEQFGAGAPDLIPPPGHADVLKEIEARQAGLARRGLAPLHERGDA